MPAWLLPGLLLPTMLMISLLAGCDSAGFSRPADMIAGRETFRFATFGNDHFWTDTLHLERAIQRSLDPASALALGLRIDMDALPPEMLFSLQEGTLDLESPETMVTLLSLDAVVGVRATVVRMGGQDSLARVGITCALCHSSVDDAASPGIGHRRDGWPNRGLDIGAILALSAELTADQRADYAAWGRGPYGRAFVAATVAAGRVGFDASAPGAVSNRFRTAMLDDTWRTLPSHPGGTAALAGFVNHFDAVSEHRLRNADKRDLSGYLKTL
jgi:hypothetical protein